MYLACSFFSILQLSFLEIPDPTIRGSSLDLHVRVTVTVRVKVSRNWGSG